MGTAVLGKKTKKSKLQPNGLKITNFLKLNLKSTCSRQIFFGSSSLWLLEYFFLQIKLFTISIGKKLTFSVYMSHNSVKILQQPKAAGVFFLEILLFFSQPNGLKAKILRGPAIWVLLFWEKKTKKS